MLRVAILALAVVALGAAVYVLGQPVERAKPVDEPALTTRVKQATPEARAPRATKKDRPADLPSFDARPKARAVTVEAVPEVKLDPNRVTRQDEAVQMYEGLLANLAEIEGSGEELSDRQKARIYKDSSTMLAGLSEHFNADDPDQVAYLEGARGMILAQLRRMKIGPPEPPDRRPKP